MKAVTAALITQVKVVNGVSPYSYNLSSGDRVNQRISLDPELLPSVSIQLVSVSESPGPDLTGFTETAIYRLFGVVPAANDTVASRISGAQDLLDDIKRAIRADRSLGGLVFDAATSISGTAFAEPAEGGIVEYGCVVVDVTVSWTELP